MGFTENQIYEKITSRKIYFPDFLDEDLKDLIDKLLQVNPKDRLGAEIEEGKNTLDDLKAHKFFQGIEFKGIHKRSPPLSANERLTMDINNKANKVPMKLDDVDSDEDSVAGAKLDKEKSVENAKTRKVQFEEIEPMNPKFSMKNKEEAKLSTGSVKKKNPDDIIKESTVEKRNKWYFYQDRQLKLTRDLRLMYFRKGEYRGDITLSKKVAVRKDHIHHFDVITPNKVFHFRCKEGDSASGWVKLIKEAIKAKVKQEKLAK